MKSLFTLILSFLILLSVGLPKRLAEFSAILRNTCEQHLPTSNYQELNSALVCGTSLSNPHTKTLLQSTGLIHLIVVSGSHLIFLQQIIAFILSTIIRRPPPFALTFWALLLFTLVTGLQAPCARAFLQMTLNQANKVHKLFWRPWTVTLLSGLVVLALFPSWIESASLLMSWVCALALSITQTLNSKLKQHALVYFTLLPILASLSVPHPNVILVNFIFTPLFGAILFPLVLLSMVFSILIPLTDALWGLLLKALAILAPYTPPLGNLQVLPVYQWIFLLSLHVIIHYFFMRRAQRA